MKRDYTKVSISTPIIMTFISCGPIGWFFYDVLICKRYDRLIYLFIMSLLVTCISTVMWLFYFRYKDV